MSYVFLNFMFYGVSSFHNTCQGIIQGVVPLWVVPPGGLRDMCRSSPSLQPPAPPSGKTNPCLQLMVHAGVAAQVEVRSKMGSS